MYRYSQEKTTNYLKTKVDRLAKPAICETSSTIVRQLAKDGLMDDGKEELLSCEYTLLEYADQVSLMNTSQLHESRQRANCFRNTFQMIYTQSS